MPRVSVILTSLNHERFVAEAIQSVLDQTYTDFELIIVDDCSDDDSWAVINSVKDSRVFSFQNTSRSRGVKGINESIRERALGEFVAIHHSDDVWTPDKLEKQLAYMDAHPDVMAVFSQAEAIGEDGKALSRYSHQYQTIFEQDNRSRFEWLRHFFMTGNSLCHPSVMVRKFSYLDAGLYDRRFGQLGDLDMWVRMCLLGDIHILTDRLVRFRILSGEANESGDRPINHVRGQIELVQILRRYLSIVNSKDIFEIFPETRVWQGDEANSVSYLVARLSLTQKDPAYWMFGLNVLYELMDSAEHRATLNEWHHFDYPQLIALTGQFDVFGKVQYWEVARELSLTQKRSFKYKLFKIVHFLTEKFR